MRPAIILALLLFHTFVEGSTNLFDGYKKKSGLIADVPAAILSNEVEFPLIGLGVGNLQSNRVENMIYEGLKGDNRIRLFDTSQVAGVDSEIIQGIKSGTKRFKEADGIDDRVQVHLVTKIRHTYLGYERTKFAVKKILQTYSPVLKDSNIDFRIHFLIHHPRCIEGVDGMDCEKDEDELSAKVKRVGPAPHLGNNDAWKESWRALEDLYSSDDYAISSIGVSNFSLEELDELLGLARAKPHQVQMSVSSLLEDTALVNRCKAHDIHIVVFNVMERIVKKGSRTPRALKSVMMAGDALSNGQNAASLGQTVLKWLIQNGISIIPRTRDLDHLSENGVGALAKLSDVSSNANTVLRKAVEAMHMGVDLNEDPRVQMSFHASDGDVFLYKYKENSIVDQTYVAYVGKGDSTKIWVNPNETFRVYDAYNPKRYRDYDLMEHEDNDRQIVIGAL